MSRIIENLRTNWLNLLVFGLTILNTAFVYTNTSSYVHWRTGSLSFCYICPWYETDQFSNVPLLMFAAGFLIVRMWWSSLVALAVSGYLMTWAVYYLLWSINWLATWKFTLEREDLGWRDFLLNYDLQFLLAVLVFSRAAHSLWSNYNDKGRDLKIS